MLPKLPPEQRQQVYPAGIVAIDTETGGFDQRINPLLSISVVTATIALQEIDGVQIRILPPEGTVLECCPPHERGDMDNPRRSVSYYYDVHKHVPVLNPDRSPCTLAQILDAGRPIIGSYAAELNGYVQMRQFPDGHYDWDMSAIDAWHAAARPAERADSTLARYLSSTFARKPLGVAHNTSFDERFVSTYLPQMYAVVDKPDRDSKKNPRWFCTYRNYQKYRKAMGLPTGAGTCTLEAMTKEAGVTERVAHDALSDSRDCLIGMQLLRDRGFLDACATFIAS